MYPTAPQKRLCVEASTASASATLFANTTSALFMRRGLASVSQAILLRLRRWIAIRYSGGNSGKKSQAVFHGSASGSLFFTSLGNSGAHGDMSTASSPSIRTIRPIRHLNCNPLPPNSFSGYSRKMTQSFGFNAAIFDILNLLFLVTIQYLNAIITINERYL